MLKIIGKLYIQNIPYALLLSVQLVIVSFIFDISFVMTAADRQVLRNVNIPEGEFYFATGKETEGVDLEKLSALLGEDKVGYIERNGNKSVGKADAIKSPGVVYLGGALSKISYELSAGTWFTGAEHEVILGGDIASDYKVGDTLVISEDDICETDMREENTAEREIEKGNIKEAGAGEEAVVVGILKSPAREPNMDTTCIDNFSELLWEKERILLTNDEHLVQGAGSGYKVETGSCLLDLSEASDRTKVQIKKEYEICPVQKTLNHAKKEQNVRTMKETVRLSILLGIAFVSVAIQVFLYVRKYKKELDIFRMLGMSWGSIYGMTLFGHICNICMGALGMYLLFQSKGILAGFGFVPDAELMKTGWYATGIFFAVYLLVTALIFGWTVHEEERREKLC